MVHPPGRVCTKKHPRQHILFGARGVGLHFYQGVGLEIFDTTDCRQFAGRARLSSC